MLSPISINQIIRKNKLCTDFLKWKIIMKRKIIMDLFYWWAFTTRFQPYKFFMFLGIPAMFYEVISLPLK